MPAVLIVTKVLADMAFGTARAAGASDLHIVPVTDVFYGLSRDEIAERAEPYCDQLEDALLS